MTDLVAPVQLAGVPPLIGRAAELTAATEAVGRALAGGGAGVLVVGGPGIGKSRLLGETVGRLSEAMVLIASGRELHAADPLAVVREALEGADLPAGLLPRLERLGSGVPAAIAGGGAVDQRLVAEVVDALEALGRRRPVILAVDDLQWADPLSLHLLWAVCRHLGDQPVAVAAATRPPGPLSGPSPRITRLLASGVEEVALGPLGDLDAGALLDAAGGRALSAGARAAAVADAGGNPQLLLAFARAPAAGGSRQQVGKLLVNEVAALSPSTAALMRTASALGTSFTVGELATVAGATAVSLMGPLDEAMQAGVLVAGAHTLGFRNRLLRDAVYDDLPVSERADLHRSAGRALAAAGAPVVTVAAQFSSACEAGDREAVEWLRRAAVDTRATAPAIAVELLQRALDLLPAPSAERHSIAAALVAPLTRIGRVRDALAVAASLDGLDLDETDVLLLRSGTALAYERRGQSADAAREWEAAATVAPTPEQAGGLRALAANAWLLSGERERALSLAVDAEAAGRRLGDAGVTAIALTTLALAAAATGNIDEAVQRAEEAVAVQGDTPIAWLGAPTAAFTLGIVLLDADELERAEAALQRGRRIAEEQGSTGYLPLYHFELAARHLLAGALDDAAAEAEAGLALAAEVETDLGVPRALARLARVALHRGDVDGAARHLAEADAVLQRSGPQLGGEVVEWVRALVLEARGDGATAVEVARAAWSATERLRYFRSYRLVGPDLVRLALAVGDRELAERVTAVVEEGARRSGLAAARGAALRCRAAVAGDADAAVAAVDAFRQGHRPLELVVALEAAAALLADGGRKAEAAPLVREAVEAAEQLGAAGDAARALALMKRLGVRRSRSAGRPASGIDALTATELRVARLVVDGLSNREVAERLYVSRYTVETHLKRVFAKLGVSSRVELVAEVRRRG